MEPVNSVKEDNAVNGNFTPSADFYKYQKLKRMFDLAIAIVLSVFFILPCGFIALIIRLGDNGPAVFKQKRIGRNGKAFYCYKFRTMKIDTPKYCSKTELTDALEYITPIGRLLRKTSLDELPQIINIIKGDMSFIGPRPMIPEEKGIHEERMKRGVYTLRPGISGLAQINGRDRIDAAEKVRLDEEYLNNICLKYDIKIFFSTFIGVLKRNDIIEGKH